MSLLALIMLICVVGVALYVINRFLPMEPRVKQILNVVVICVLVVYLLKLTGVWAALSRITL
jgi:hypothetical protein